MDTQEVEALIGFGDNVKGMRWMVDVVACAGPVGLFAMKAALKLAQYDAVRMHVSTVPLWWG